MRGLETASPPPKTERRVSLRVGRGPERGAPHILDKALEIWLLGFFGIVITEGTDCAPCVLSTMMALGVSKGSCFY